MDTVDNPGFFRKAGGFGVEIQNSLVWKRTVFFHVILFVPLFLILSTFQIHKKWIKNGYEFVERRFSMFLISSRNE